ncbi:iron-sulfur cluster insertion protein [Limimonas halophila]|uniref:Iron-sulfur cluster insertion protein n=1 Tax=Limimonas halophila TaxID=1082479 RepID=A0A1G7NG52_9PROT|nr:iron-sulfur cluster insertion protein ErpA [Limimonas halophila]SDF72946.1 iron-sulfur cluster insertion protein [Limimonas halophila]
MADSTQVEIDAADGAATGATGLLISDNAAKQIAKLREQEGDQALMLRVSVGGGGCSGFQYSFDFDRTVNDDDRTFHNGDVTVVVDEVSLELLAGSQIDYKQELIGSYFEINNPNASSSCGCGSSFSI